MPNPTDLFTGYPGIINIFNRRSRNCGGLCGNRSRPNTDFLVIHHSGGSTLEGCLEQLSADGNSYHFIIDKNAKVYQLVPIQNAAGHALAANNYSVGICLIGNNDSDVKRRRAQIDAAVALGKAVLLAYGLPNNAVYGHGETKQGKEADEGRTVTLLIRNGQTPPPYTLPGRSGGGNGHSGPRGVNARAGTNPRTQPRADTPTAISPYIASLESFHPNIQYELTRRRNASETANTYMPFVRLTSLVNVYKKNLRGSGDTTAISRQTGRPIGDEFGAYCPTLGIDGQPEISFDDIYTPQDENGNVRSIVGYATQEIDVTDESGTSKKDYIRVPLVVEKNATETDPPNIPIPGIVGMTTERSTAGPMGVRGGLFRATINIRAYSVGQLNTLLKYFIRPATRVILELGRTSSSHYEQNLTIDKPIAGQTLFKKFDWKRSLTQISTEDGLEEIITGKIGQRDFIQKYIYNNFGDYEIFIGYVVNFKIKYTKENVYEIELLVHSVQQFEITTKNTGVQSSSPESAVPNPCNTVEISDYFNANAYWRSNSFSNLLKKSIDEGDNRVISLQDQGATPGSGTIKSPGHLVTWEYFVNVILNDREYGILSLFQQTENNPALDLLRSSLLKPIKSSDGEATDLNANEVPWNPSLRSTDPNTMIIYNKSAQTTSRITNATAQSLVAKFVAYGQVSQEEREKVLANILLPTVADKIESADSPVGSFDPVSPGASVSSLTKGVWINTNAIIDAFSSTDTVSMAITRLLNSMNAAVQGYWNLQPLSSEEMSGMYVIDAGMSKPVDLEVVPDDDDTLITSNIDNLEQQLGIFLKPGTSGSFARPQYLYAFNRKTQTLQSYTDENGTPIAIEGDIGGELLDINIDSSLPQVVAVQAIAGVGGVGDNGTFSAINIDELKALTLYPGTYVRPIGGTVGICKDDSNTFENRLEGISAPNLEPAIAKEIFDSFQNPRATEQVFEQDINTYVKSQGALAFKAWAEQNTNATDEQKTERQRLIDQDIENIRAAVSSQQESRNKGFLGLVREYGGVFGMAVDLVEYDITKLAQKLQVNKEEFEVHPFNSSNLTKTIVDLTLPGVGGIQLWQSFMIARVPNIIKRGFYVVTKISHEFAIDKGWVTKLQGRFRFKPDTTTRTAGAVRRTESGTPATPATPAATAPRTPAATASAASAPAAAPAAPAQPTNDLTTLSDDVLGSRWEALKSSIKKPFLPGIAARERWESRVASGEINRLRNEFNQIQAEIDRRVAVYRGRNQVIPRVLRGKES